MTFLTTGVAGFVFLTSLLTPTITAQAPSASPSSTTQPASSSSATATITPPSVAPPTLSEMQGMSAEELDAAGDKLRTAKDYLSALDLYRQAIHKHSKAEYYNKVAITELLLRHPVEAEKAARKAVHKDKRLAEAWNNLGVSYYMRQDYEHSIHAYERAITLKPDYASFHSNLAATLMDMKQYEQGVAEYRKAFVLDPTFFEHTSQNGISAHMSSPQDRAQFDFVMARLFAGTGDLDRALHFLRSAMENGYPEIDEVYRDQEFTALREDARFQELMKDRPPAIR